MATNHGGDPLGSIMGSMGSDWVKKNGSKALKITMPQNSHFRLPAVIDFFLKNGSYVYGAKSRWDHNRSWGQWGPIGSKKWVKSMKN